MRKKAGDNILTIINKHKRKINSILIDVDDTIYDFVGAILKPYNEYYNDNLTKEDITDWKIHDFLKPECKNIFAQFSNVDLHLNLQPFEYAVETINTLVENDYDIHFLTAIYADNVPTRHKLLSKTFGEKYDYEKLIVCKDKHLVHSDLLIDDCISNFSDSVTYKILYEQPWNRKCKLDKDMTRCNEWKYGIPHVINSINKY